MLNWAVDSSALRAAVANDVDAHRQRTIQTLRAKEPAFSARMVPESAAVCLESPVFAKLTDEASALSRMSRDGSQLFLGREKGGHASCTQTR